MNLARRIVLATMFVALAASIAAAQSGTPEEQAACRPDVRRFCFKVKPDAGDDAFLQCLQSHREKLSPKCLTVLTTHGV